jgi:hypothetical protein
MNAAPCGLSNDLQVNEPGTFVDPIMEQHCPRPAIRVFKLVMIMQGLAVEGTLTQASLRSQRLCDDEFVKNRKNLLSCINLSLCKTVVCQ